MHKNRPAAHDAANRDGADQRLAAEVQRAAELELAVVERTRQLRELSLAMSAMEERERRSIAENLHDDLGQLLALLKIRLELLQRKLPAGLAAVELSDASTLLLQAIDRVRSLAFQLSPAILHELGLIPALEWLGEEMKRLYGLQVSLDADAASREPLDAGVRTVLFRAVRELLINVGKHAGTQQAHVQCRRNAEGVVITVSDSGKGFDPDVIFTRHGSRGFGLLSVRERLIGLNGAMDCQSIPGDGSRVTLRVPLDPLPPPLEATP